MGQRHFLFLQGLPGPSFRLIARQLEALGHTASHVVMNGGDLVHRRWQGRHYRGDIAGFGLWLTEHCRIRGITDLVLFGEMRPLHLAAIAAARDLGLDVHVFEEGYLRPNSVTLEFWPKGLAWQPPRSLDECRARVQTSAEEQPVANRFGRRLAESIFYWLWCVLLTPLFPRYRSHRRTPAAVEMVQWWIRTARRPGEQASSRAALTALDRAEFFLFPLQLDGDAQLVHRSPHLGMAQALDAVLASFARAAPADARLVIKRHPYDPDPRRWGRIVASAAARHGLTGRVHYIALGELDPLLAKCRGVITVNSTVGALALRAGRPAHTLGTALYAMPGLASSGDPDAFWTAPQPVADGAYAVFSAALFGECLINAGLHSREGLDLLATRAAQRMAEAGR
jgi:capsular polysaccharide export protein